MSDEKVTLKDYTSHSNRILNRLIKLREKQIRKAEEEKSTTTKSLAQLKFELETMTTTLMERSMHKIGEDV
jgi:hypothetical protein